MSGAHYGAEIDYWTILMVHCVLFIYMSRGHHTSECFILVFNLFLFLFGISFFFLYCNLELTFTY